MGHRLLGCALPSSDRARRRRTGVGGRAHEGWIANANSKRSGTPSPSNKPRRQNRPPNLRHNPRRAHRQRRGGRTSTAQPQSRLEGDSQDSLAAKKSSTQAMLSRVLCRRLSDLSSGDRRMTIRWIKMWGYSGRGATPLPDSATYYGNDGQGQSVPPMQGYVTISGVHNAGFKVSQHSCSG